MVRQSEESTAPIALLQLRNASLYSSGLSAQHWIAGGVAPLRAATRLTPIVGVLVSSLKF